MSYSSSVCKVSACATWCAWRRRPASQSLSTVLAAAVRSRPFACPHVRAQGVSLYVQWSGNAVFENPEDFKVVLDNPLFNDAGADEDDTELPCAPRCRWAYVETAAASPDEPPATASQDEPSAPPPLPETRAMRRSVSCHDFEVPPPEEGGWWDADEGGLPCPSGLSAVNLPRFVAPGKDSGADCDLQLLPAGEASGRSSPRLFLGGGGGGDGWLPGADSASASSSSDCCTGAEAEEDGNASCSWSAEGLSSQALDSPLSRVCSEGPFEEIAPPSAEASAVVLATSRESLPLQSPDMSPEEENEAIRKIRLLSEPFVDGLLKRLMEISFFARDLQQHPPPSAEEVRRAAPSACQLSSGLTFSGARSGAGRSRSTCMRACTLLPVCQGLPPFLLPQLDKDPITSTSGHVEIGRGGFGVVYAAWACTAGRPLGFPVALKVTSFAQRDGTTFADALVEPVLMRSLRYCDGLARYGAHWETVDKFSSAGHPMDGRMSLVMELCPRGSLFEFIVSRVA
jgi:hypothetical protein